MIEIQELIARGRFIFSGAEKRLGVFKLANGKRTAKEIARKMGRSQSSVLQDIKMMLDMGLIRKKKNREGAEIKRGKSLVFEKAPIAKHIPMAYFNDVAETRKLKMGTATIFKSFS